MFVIFKINDAFQLLKMNKLNNKLFQIFQKLSISPLRRLTSLPEVLTINQQRELDETPQKPKSRSVLEPCDEEEVAHVAPYLKPSYNFAAYVNNSETLQELLKLGVDLHKLEKRKNVSEFILPLKFETDIKEHVIFLHDLGLTVEQIGAYITRNPFVFKDTLDNMRVRVNYLESKKFTPEMILRIVENNPYWLSFSTKDIDMKLGYFQKTFDLTGDEVRQLTVKQPKLITYTQNHIKQNLFALKEQMGFSVIEYKSILLKKPRLFMNDHKKLLETFEYVHNTMKIPQEMIAQMPEVLACRVFRLRQRFEYLQQLNKVQFNPKQPGYISPALIVAGTDAEFVADVAQTSIQSYDTFLKTL